MTEQPLGNLEQRLDGLERQTRWWKILLVLGALPLGGLPAEAVPAASCFASDKEPRSLTCNLGLELWEEGKKSERIFQSWHLTCGEVARQPWCSLERTQFLLLGEAGISVAVHRHSTSDGGLKLWRLDWAKGELSFDVIYQRGERMPVVIRLKPVSEKFPSFLAVKSFEAKDVVRTLVGPVVSQELRLPEHSYMLNVPIPLHGRESSDAKARDDLTQKLSAADRQVFDRILSAGGAGCIDLETWFKQEPLKTLLGPYDEKLKELERQELEGLKESETKKGLQTLQAAQAEKQRITNEFFQKTKPFLINKTLRCLADAGMSKEGVELTTNALLGAILEGTR